MDNRTDTTGAKILTTLYDNHLDHTQCRLKRSDAYGRLRGLRIEVGTCVLKYANTSMNSHEHKLGLTGKDKDSYMAELLAPTERSSRVQRIHTCPSMCVVVSSHLFWISVYTFRVYMDASDGVTQEELNTGFFPIY